MFKIGITERGDAGLDHSWVDKLLPINIIISKTLNDWLIETLVSFQKQIIFHMTCTGFGGTFIEPNVPDKSITFNQLAKLLEAGFPPSQIVFRIDPIIPTDKGINNVIRIIDEIIFRFEDIHRIRYSYIDMYPHVIKRFKESHIGLPFKGFHAPNEWMKKFRVQINRYSNSNLEFESCAEEDKHKLGCISQKDFTILGIDLPSCLTCPGKQRKACACLNGKTELLNSKNQCENKCIYCYWKG